MQDAPFRSQPTVVIQRALERANKRCDEARSDGEYEANRQIAIWLKSLLEERRAA